MKGSRPASHASLLFGFSTTLVVGGMKGKFELRSAVDTIVLSVVYVGEERIN